MGNYQYIVTGLPNIIPDYESKSFSYQGVRDEVYELCSQGDRKLIEFLEKDFSEDLDASVFADAAKSKNRFIREFFAFDREFRNLKVTTLAEQMSVDAAKYLVGDLDPFFADKAKIQAVLNEENILLREKALDRIVWDKVNDLTAFDYFDVEKILAFLVKARITDRWCKMDKVQGAKIFKQLVDEVRSTYKGLKSYV